MKLSKSYFALIISSLFVLNSCGILSETSGKSESTDQSPGSGSVLSDILNTVMGKAPLTYKNMAGTWDYKKSAVAFETDNLLKKAGGIVIATQVEEKLNETSKSLGITSANTTFTFNTDSTYTAKIRGVKISGKYTIDAQTKKVRMSYLLGVGHLDAVAAVSAGNMKLLFDADSFLKLMKFISQFTNNTSIEVLGKMAEMYDGMLMGFDLRKQ